MEASQWLKTKPVNCDGFGPCTLQSGMFSVPPVFKSGLKPSYLQFSIFLWRLGRETRKDCVGKRHFGFWRFHTGQARRWSGKSRIICDSLLPFVHPSSLPTVFCPQVPLPSSLSHLPARLVRSPHRAQPAAWPRGRRGASSFPLGPSLSDSAVTAARPFARTSAKAPGAPPGISSRSARLGRLWRRLGFRAKPRGTTSGSLVVNAASLFAAYTASAPLPLLSCFVVLVRRPAPERPEADAISPPSTPARSSRAKKSVRPLAARPPLFAVGFAP